MYFYKENGKQCLDLQGDLILSHNNKLTKTRSKSAAPSKVNNAQYILVKKINFLGRVYATFVVIAFIWGSDKQLKREDTNYRESHRANVVNMRDREQGGELNNEGDKVDNS